MWKSAPVITSGKSESLLTFASHDRSSLHDSATALQRLDKEGQHYWRMLRHRRIWKLLGSPQSKGGMDAGRDNADAAANAAALRLNTYAKEPAPRA
jgi:hypothetical protein